MKLPIIAQLLGAHPDSVPDTDIHWLLTDIRSKDYAPAQWWQLMKTEW